MASAGHGKGKMQAGGIFRSKGDAAYGTAHGRQIYDQDYSAVVDVVETRNKINAGN